MMYSQKPATQDPNALFFVFYFHYDFSISFTFFFVFLKFNLTFIYQFKNIKLELGIKTNQFFFSIYFI